MPCEVVDCVPEQRKDTWGEIGENKKVTSFVNIILELISWFC